MRRASIFATLLAAALAALLIPAPAGASTPTWHTYRISHAGDLATVRCPSSSVCVALSHAGQVLTTKNAGAVRPTWKVTAGLKVMGPEEDSEQRVAYNLSCPSVHLCVTSFLSKIITTTNPTGPASAWHAVDVQPAGLDAEGKIDSLTCPSVSLCVAGMNEWSNEEGGGTSLEFATTTSPAGEASAWNVFPAPTFVDYLTQVACSPGRVCAGGDEGSGVIASINPTGGTTDWSRVTSLASQLQYGTCPSISLCVGATAQGRLAYSRIPVGSAWHQSKLPSGRYLTTVSCAGTGFCAGTGGDARHVTGVLTSTQPTNASRYSLHTFSARGDRLNAVTCRSSSLCIAVGDGGLVAVLRRGA